MNINSLTLGEVAEIEKRGGASISSFSDDTQPRGRMLQAIVYVFKKREDSTYRFEDAANVSLTEAMAMLNDDHDKSGAGQTE